MPKETEVLVEKYKKSNKVRREQLAQKNGFKSGEEYLKSLLTTKTTKRSVKKKKEEKVVMDYVIAFDTTGSMSSYIGAVKEHVKELIPEMFSKGIDLKMKIVAFGDYCDMPSVNYFGKAYQETELTNDENVLINFVRTVENTSGGDSDEFYELVIKKITEETPWRKNSTRTVLLIADADPHRVGYTHSRIKSYTNQIDWKKEARKAASLNIQFDTLTINGQRWYKELSDITNGICLPFKSSNKVTEVVTASAYARGSKMSKTSFSTAYASAVSSGDEELIGMYKTMSAKL